jgi:hypothetical protein
MVAAKQLSIWESEAYIKFQIYHRENPQIYEYFKKFTFQAINKGFKHWSAEAVFNICRWETGVSGNDEFKINNNYKAWYSRLFMNDFPEHKGFFQLRESKADQIN